MAKEETDLVTYINDSLGMNLPPAIAAGELRSRLAAHINELINHDFHRLVSLLYRIDISEKKLKQLLADNPGQDAAPMIAGMIIERQAQKAGLRQRFRQTGENTIDENEKW
jgi:hypothetical protein